MTMRVAEISKGAQEHFFKIISKFPILFCFRASKFDLWSVAFKGILDQP